MDDRAHRLIDHAFRVLDPQTEDGQDLPDSEPDSREWQELVGLLAYRLDQNPPPAELKANLLERLVAVSSRSSAASSAEERSHSDPLSRPAPSFERASSRVAQSAGALSFPSWSRWAAAAVLLVALGLAALAGFRFGHTSAQADQLARLEELRDHLALVSSQKTQLCRLEPQDPAQPEASGTVFMHPVEKRWVMTAANLLPTTGGRHYHVWFMVDDRPILVGSFQVEEHARVEIGSDNLPTNPTAVMITVEPTDSASTPTGATVLYGNERRSL